MQEAWAVAKYDEIDIATVSKTRRAAIVNWLVVEAKCMVTNEWTDADIERVWDHAGAMLNYRAIRVSVLPI